MPLENLGEKAVLCSHILKNDMFPSTGVFLSDLRISTGNNELFPRSNFCKMLANYLFTTYAPPKLKKGRSDLNLSRGFKQIF